MKKVELTLKNCVDTLMSIAIIFPGQGSQAIGMGKALAESFPAAREVFEEVDEALKQKLSQLMFDGDAADLNLTANTQPAIMAVSLAACRVLQQQGLLKFEQLKYAAGHSLGEYSALAATNALSVHETACLLRTRGDAMQRAVPVGAGAMAALLGADLAGAQALAAAAAGNDVCSVANDNAPGQVVISGHLAAIERAEKLAPEHGIKRAVRLPVSAPFHCPLMAPAAVIMQQQFTDVVFQPSAIPIVANITAEVVLQTAAWPTLLVEQVTGMVRWRESMLYMNAQGITHFIEIGPGKVLSGLVKRIAPDAQSYAVGEPKDLDDFAGFLGQ